MATTLSAFEAASLAKAQAIDPNINDPYAWYRDASGNVDVEAMMLARVAAEVSIPGTPIQEEGVMSMEEWNAWAIGQEPLAQAAYAETGSAVGTVSATVPAMTFPSSQIMTAGFGFDDILEWIAGLSAVIAAGTGVWNTIQGLFGDSGGAAASAVGMTDTGGDSSMTMTDYGIGGPGVPEPSTGVLKQWKTKAFANDVGEYWVYYFKMLDGYTLCYNARKKEWKRWKPRKNIVLSSNPRLNTIARAERVVMGKLRQLAKKSKTLALAKR